MLHPQFGKKSKVLAKGLGASPGAAVGRAYFTADEAEAAFKKGEDVILVRSETSPEDVHGMMASKGILTARGGLVSHAAVVARGWGTPAVVGADAVKITGKQFQVGDTTVKQGDWLSLDGTTGEVMIGKLELAASKPPEPSSRRSSSGPTRSARASSPCAPTPTPARTPPTPGRWAPRASACAVPSTCSSRPTGSRSCAR